MEEDQRQWIEESIQLAIKAKENCLHVIFVRRFDTDPDMVITTAQDAAVITTAQDAALLDSLARASRGDIPNAGEEQP